MRFLRVWEGKNDRLDAPSDSILCAVCTSSAVMRSKKSSGGRRLIVMASVMVVEDEDTSACVDIIGV